MFCDILEDASMEFPTMLCLGLGSPTGSRDARIQLAFILAICRKLEIVRVYTIMYLRGK